MRRLILGMALTAIVLPALHAQDDFDDIYYNPKSDTGDAKSNKSKNGKKESNYIADFSTVDVDSYNRRDNFYYETAIDTIGSEAENGEDFVYTQQIQKYYNPTIVVDNSDVLADILEDSYGNVDIVIENGNPCFASIYTGAYGWTPSYYNWSFRPSWTWSWGWGPVYASWTWGPSWTWGFDPYWGYNPYWGWSYPWGPSWGWGPSWAWRPGPSWGPGPGNGHRPPHYAHGGGASRPTAPNPGWSANTRPGGNYNGGGSRPGHSVRGDGNGGMMAHRPISATGSQASSASGRPVGGVTSRPNGSATIAGNRTWGKRANQQASQVGTMNQGQIQTGNTHYNDHGGVNGNSANRRRYSTGSNTGLTQKSANTNIGTVSNGSTTNSARRSYNTKGTSTTRQTTSTGTYNRSNSGSSNRSTTSRGSYNSGSSSRGSFSHGSGGSRGGSRSGGGGGHRGGRR